MPIECREGYAINKIQLVMIGIEYRYTFTCIGIKASDKSSFTTNYSDMSKGIISLPLHYVGNKDVSLNVLRRVSVDVDSINRFRFNYILSSLRDIEFEKGLYLKAKNSKSEYIPKKDHKGSNIKQA
jgi:hypothetical protein